MDRIRFCADLSIRRACGFALLAIATAVAGNAFAPALAVRTAATLISLMAAVLTLMAWHAPHRDYRRTEVWILLDKKHNLPPHRAQEVIGGVLHDRYQWHADVTLAVAALLWAVVVILDLSG
jgi:hypothetical protein